MQGALNTSIVLGQENKLKSSLKYFLPIWQSGNDLKSFIIKQTFLLRLGLVKPILLPAGPPKLYCHVSSLPRTIGPGFSCVTQLLILSYNLSRRLHNRERQIARKARVQKTSINLKKKKSNKVKTGSHRRIQGRSVCA